MPEWLFYLIDYAMSHSESTLQTGRPETLNLCPMQRFRMSLFVRLNIRIQWIIHRLVRECLKGKSQAQRELYEHFAEIMLGVCYRYTRSVRDAEDVLQEGFVKVFHHLKQYKQEGELGAWIRRIMVNTALNYLKRHRKYQEEMFFTEEYLHPVADDDPTIRLQRQRTGRPYPAITTGIPGNLQSSRSRRIYPCRDRRNAWDQ